MIVAAAIKFGDDLVCFTPKPGRHHNVLEQICRLAPEGYWSDWRYSSEVQGFLNDKGEFLNRRDAFAHVKEIGQPLTRRQGPGYYQGDELFSEDLW